MDAINYRLEVFEGPLDLLLSLIQKNKMSIDNIQIGIICEQYLEYIEAAQSLDMELASEFLVMASELMLIKSKLLLPKPEAEEEDPRAELVQKLLEYKMYKYMSYELKDRQMDGALRMYKEPTIPDEVKEYEPPVDLDALLDGITLSKLNDIFKEIMKRQHDKIDPVRSTFGKIEKEEITVEDKMEYLNTYISKHKKFSFRDLLTKQKSKTQLVVTFLAILEMMKMGKIWVEQENTFDDIVITSKVMDEV